MNRRQQDMVFGAVGLLIFLVIGMVGLLIILQTAFWGSWGIIGWILLGAGAILAIEVLQFIDKTYRLYPRELRKLILALIITGVAIGIVATGLEDKSRLTDFRMTCAVFGLCWAFSGVYLLLKRNVVF